MSQPDGGKKVRLTELCVVIYGEAEREVKNTFAALTFSSFHSAFREIFSSLMFLSFIIISDTKSNHLSSCQTLWETISNPYFWLMIIKFKRRKKKPCEMFWKKGRLKQEFLVQVQNSKLLKMHIREDVFLCRDVKPWQNSSTSYWLVYKSKSKVPHQSKPNVKSFFFIYTKQRCVCLGKQCWEHDCSSWSLYNEEHLQHLLIKQNHQKQ